jgi:hypothetical protein
MGHKQAYVEGLNIDIDICMGGRVTSRFVRGVLVVYG